MEIQKWHVYLADLSPRFGTEPGKLRPVIVIQTNLLNEAGHLSTIICPITTKILPKTKWLRLHLKKNEASLKEPSDVLIDQVRAIDNRRFKKHLGVIHKENQLSLIESIKVVLDL